MASTRDFALLQRSVSDILGFQGQSAADTAAATGENYAVTGNQAEATAYGNAAAIAGQDAQLAGVAGQIQEYQAKRQVAQATGAEQADVGAAGFTMSGSNLAALRSSYQQGYLADQMIRTQTQLNQGGYLEQKVAATGEQGAATAAAGAASALGTAYTTAAGVAKTNAANETAALLGFIKDSGTTVGQDGRTWTIGGIGGTPEGNLVTSILSGTPGATTGASGLPTAWENAMTNAAPGGALTRASLPTSWTGGTPGTGQTVSPTALNSAGQFNPGWGQLPP